MFGEIQMILMMKTSISNNPISQLNEQNVMSYSQLRKKKSIVKKFQTVYLFPTLYLKSKYI